MKEEWNFTEMIIFPNVAVKAVRTEIEVGKLPAIQGLAVSAGIRNMSEGKTFCPTETIFVLENENGTYEVLNDLRRIQPELSRVSAKSIEVILIDRKDFEMSKEEETLVREFLLRVIPLRSAGDNSDIAQNAHQGHLDRFHPFYGSNRSTAGTFASVAPMFVDGQIKRSTFNCQRSELRKPFKKTLRNATQQARRRKQDEATRREKKEAKRREKKGGEDNEQDTEWKKEQGGLFDDE